MACVAWALIGAWIIGRVLTDRFLWSQWLWWIPTPVILGVALIGLLAALRPGERRRVKGRRAAIWVAIIAAILIYFIGFEHHLLRGDRAPGAGVRIAHWNLSHPTEQTEIFVEAIDSLESDILILSSLNIAARRLLHDAQPHTVDIFTVISKHPVRASRSLTHGEGPWIALVEFDTREALGADLLICLVDLPSDPGIARMEVAERVAERLDGLSLRAPDLVVGDFNILRGSASIERMFPDYRHAYRDAGHGFGATYPRRFPVYHIDHVLLSKSYRATDYDIIDPGIGRHRAQAASIMRAD